MGDGRLKAALLGFLMVGALAGCALPRPAPIYSNAGFESEFRGLSPEKAAAKMQVKFLNNMYSLDDFTRLVYLDDYSPEVKRRFWEQRQALYNNVMREMSRDIADYGRVVKASCYRAQPSPMDVQRGILVFNCVTVTSKSLVNQSHRTKIKQVPGGYKLVF